MAEGPDRGLTLIDRIEGLDDYYLLHPARAALLRPGGRHEERCASSRPAAGSLCERRLAQRDERGFYALGRRGRPLQALDIPAGLEHNDAAAESLREADLGQGPPAAADGDQWGTSRRAGGAA